MLLRVVSDCPYLARPQCCLARATERSGQRPQTRYSWKTSLETVWSEGETCSAAMKKGKEKSAGKIGNWSGNPGWWWWWYCWASYCGSFAGFGSVWTIWLSFGGPAVKRAGVGVAFSVAERGSQVVSFVESLGSVWAFGSGCIELPGVVFLPPFYACALQPAAAPLSLFASSSPPRPLATAPRAHEPHSSLGSWYLGDMKTFR